LVDLLLLLASSISHSFIHSVPGFPPAAAPTPTPTPTSLACFAIYS
jgi:hypothetical protein